MRSRRAQARLCAAALLGSMLAADAGPPDAAGGVIVVVRHAEKAPDAADPPLSVAGRLRAEALVEALAGLDLVAILVSPAERSRQTAEPLARSRGLTPQVIPFAPDVDAQVRETLARATALRAGGAVLVVGHSNTVPAIVAGLGGQPFQPLPDCAFERIWLLGAGLRPEGWMALRYGAPDHCPE